MAQQLYPLSMASAVVTSVADIGEVALAQASLMSRIQAHVSTAVVSSGAVVISAYARPVFGSSVGQVLLGTLSVPAGTAAGKVLYKDISDKLGLVKAGQSVAFSVSTAAAGGGAAGAVVPMALYADSPEVPANQSGFVLSA